MSEEKIVTTKKINVCYVTRVEGQAAINVEVAGTGQAKAEFAVFEPIRFFEAFLVGRMYDEVHELTSRLCGICPIAHQITALRAVENALKVKVTPQTKALRRLLALSAWIQSHTLSLYFLTAPDYLGFEGAVAMASKHGDAVRRALRLKKLGNDLGEIIGGRAVHPISAVFGGFTKTPRKEDLTEIRQRLKEEKDDVWSTVDLFRSFSYPEINRDTELVAISNDEEYAVNEGRLTSSKGLDASEEDYRKHIRESEAKHSNTKASYLNGKDFIVGPLARINLNYDKLTPDAKKATEQLDLHIPTCNPFMHIKARVAELVYSLDECMRIIDTLRLDVSEQPIKAEIGIIPCLTPCEGFALTEAPRGLLYHAYKLDSDGAVQKADLVPPTAHNSASIEASLRAFAPELVRKDQDLLLGCEKLVRSYDPCISCSVHVTRLKRGT
jgi:coenzyme F420-reducing hydrogenase alpha subunit